MKKIELYDTVTIPSGLEGTVTEIRTFSKPMSPNSVFSAPRTNLRIKLDDGRTIEMADYQIRDCRVLP